VDEARRKNTYVLAHCYTAEAVRHALHCGVRSIEHGIFIDAEAAAIVVARDAFVVPTLANFEANLRLGPLNEMFRGRVKELVDASRPSLEICRAAGVKLGFGTDVIGKYQKFQTLELSIRADVLPVAEVLFSATSTNAALLNRAGEIGVVAAGALADILVVDGDPLRDLQLLQDEGAHLRAIMKAGRFYKCELSTH
jgi:imidazolonepropionase-like amidohydrolase